MDRRQYSGTRKCVPGVSLLANATHTIKQPKPTLTALLEVLNTMQDSDLKPAFDKFQVDEPGEGPNVDEHVQTQGAASFDLFHCRVRDLDRELRSFSNAVSHLGSCVGLLSSAFQFRQRLSRVLHLLHENAAELFPHKVKRDDRDLGEYSRRFTQTRMRYKSPPNVARPQVSDDMDPECFPGELELLAQNTVTFLKFLNEFPEFWDEGMNASISAFEGDVKFWASCLTEFKGQFRYPGVTRYVHDLANEIGEHLEQITVALKTFIDVGVPAIQFAQQHGSTNRLNLLTIATFFSAVTATTIQYSYTLNESPLHSAVNAFWFSSLVLSVASVVNSLLGLSWKQAIYRSPVHRVPWWVGIWIKQGPLIFLVNSVAAFSVGLVLFTYASQPRIVATVVTCFTGFSSFGLLVVSSWFVFERWTFVQHRGRKWLVDVLIEFRRDLFAATGFAASLAWATNVLPTHIERAATWSRTHVDRASSSIYQVTTRSFTIFRRHDVELNVTLPQHSTATPISPLVPSPRRVSASPDSPLSFPAASASVTPRYVQYSTPPSAAKSRFRNAVRSVIILRTGAISNPRWFIEPIPQRTATTNTASSGGDPRRDSLDSLMESRYTRLMSNRSTLQTLNVAQSVSIHKAPVRHLMFSPNGKWLATCGWDRSGALVRVEDVTSNRVLAHPRGIGQVAWSPNGSLLLTKLPSGIKIWTENGVCKRTINRPTVIQSIVWFPNGREILSIEGDSAIHLNMTGTVLDTYHFDRLQLHDVAISPDGERLVGVATLNKSKDGLLPVTARPSKRIFAYNRLEKRIECQIPVLHEARDITISRNGELLLVSYEHKAPPQLWRIDMVKRDMRLSLRHTYMPSFEVDFAGLSYFGGNDDQLILCAGKAGDIHIWDRESGTLLHSMKPRRGEDCISCIASNHASERCMFATGSHDGTVRIWTSSGPLTHSPDPSGPPSPTAATHHIDKEERSDSPLDLETHTLPIANGGEDVHAHTIFERPFGGDVPPSGGLAHAEPSEADYFARSVSFSHLP